MFDVDDYKLLINEYFVNDDLLRSFFIDLVNTGLRPCELYYFSHVVSFENNLVEIQLAKRQDIRYINTSLFSADFFSRMASGYTTYVHYSLSHLAALIQMALLPHWFQINGKVAKLYLPRYLYVQKMKSEGASLEDVCTHMKHSSTDVTLSYYNPDIVML